MASISDHGGRRGGIKARLLRSCTGCGAALEGDPVRCPRCRRLRPRTGWHDLRVSSDPWLGREIDGRYIVTRRLGAGAAASVYEARTPYSGDRCALKIIDLSVEPFCDDVAKWSNQVRSEVEILARVRSPHILKFYDIVEIPGPAVVIVSEFIDGETLGRVLGRDGPIEAKRALEWMRQVAVGMAEVHRRGAVHRDLKPDNLLLQRFHGRDEFVHVIDFGIVQIGNDVLRGSGYVGTPQYSSPEQSRGMGIGPKSDIYSLGAVLFKLLTGTTPFEGASTRDLLAQHAFTRAPSIRESNPDGAFDPRVTGLVASMLEKDPGERPDSMRDIAERIARIRWADEERAPSAPTATATTKLEVPDTGEHPRVSATQPPDGAPVDFAVPAKLPPPLAVSGEGRLARMDRTGTVRFRPHWRSAEAERPIWRPSVGVGALWLRDASLICGHVDGSLARLEVTTGTSTPMYRNPALAPVTGLDGSSGGELEAVGAATGHVRLRGPLAPTGDDGFLPSGPPVTCLAVAPSGTAVAVGRSDALVEVYGGEHGEWCLERSLRLDSVPADLRVSEDGFLLSTWTVDWELAIYNLTSGERLTRRPACRLQAQLAFLETDAICLPECRSPGPKLCARLP